MNANGTSNDTNTLNNLNGSAIDALAGYSWAAIVACSKAFQSTRSDCSADNNFFQAAIA